MASPAHLVAHQFTPERARAARAKAQPALRILAAHRSLQAAVKRTKGQRIHLDGPRVVAIVSDLSARTEQSEVHRRTLDQRLAALERAPSRAEYRRAKLASYLGEAAVAHMAPGKPRRSPSPNTPPINPTDEPSMVEPIWDALPQSPS